MKIAIAASLTLVLATSVAIWSFLFSSSESSTGEPLDTISELSTKEHVPETVTTDRQTEDKLTLPDYHPDEPVVSGKTSEKIPEPSSVDETLSQVESSLKNQIGTLGKNLDDPEVRAALRRELSSPDMEAYKQAILWKVKRENTEIQ